jgi:chromosome segregation ATPase
MKKQLTEIDSKLKPLRLKLKQAEEIITKCDREAIKWHWITILNLTRAVEDLRSSIEGLKFSAGESEETVTTCSQEIAQELSHADKSCAELSKCAKVIDDEFKAAKRQETVIEFEKQLIEQKLT